MLRDIISDKLYADCFSITYEKEKINLDIKKQYKISFCTTCMDRLSDLKQTYIQNIKDNMNYKNIEFVLLNYNSHEDIDSWVKDALSKYIEKGIVNYYKTTEPKYYSMTHSRNIAFRLATGDIVNNIDADHFTTEGLAERINYLANHFHGQTVFVKSHHKNRGRIGMFKKDFIFLGGYNEDIIGYGYDDKDLLCRAYHSGFKVIKTGGKYFKLAANHHRHFGDRYAHKNWRYTQERNALMSLFNITRKIYIANQDKEWGKTLVTKNLKDEKLDSCEFA